MVTLMTLELYRYDEPMLAQQFQRLLAQAPRFFENRPVVVSLEHLHNPDSPVDLHRLKRLCADFGINLMAIRGGLSVHRENASEAGMAWLAAPPSTSDRKSTVQISQQEIPLAEVKEFSATPLHPDKPKPNSVAPQEQPATARVIDTPIRSGQQIYHNGDLIITAPVSVGAEVLATGHIHIYAPLRGRALAGIRGDSKARIYCTHFEPELVSIHGHYKTISKADCSDLWQKAIQIYMDGDSLKMTPMYLGPKE